MATLITLVLFGIITALFATQNTAYTTINLAGVVLQNIPLYLLVLGSMLAGLMLAGVINLIESIATGIRIMGKNQMIKSSQKEVVSLKERIVELEAEKEKLGIPAKSAIL